MSYILEALRKSERERQSKQSPGLDAVVLDQAKPARPWLPWVLVGALVVLNGLALSYVLLRDSRQPPLPPAAAVQAQPAALPPSPKPAVANQPDAVIPIAAAKPVPVAKAPEKGRARAANESVREAKPAVTEEEASEDIPAPTKHIDKPQPALSHTKETEEDQDKSGYKINVLAYTTAPEERFVVINMSKYTKGDRLPDGAVIENIEEDGVVLSRHGRRLRIRH